MSHVPLPDPEVFGEREEGLVYVERLGVYALVGDGAGRLVVVEEGGPYLPGGGIERGEAADEALRRELAEEVGLAPTAWRYLDVARQLLVDPETGTPWEKVERFYAVTVDEDGELGPDARWVELAEAAEILTEEAQRWAVQRWGDTRP